MSDPWLAVIMPTYNGAEFVAEALSSIEAQRDNRLEVIAIDDGSTDATIRILQGYSTRLLLRIIQRPHVGNWVANSNYALSLAKADYACFLHQDDFWLPQRLAIVMQLLARAPRATLLLQPAWFVDPQGRRLGQWRCPLPADRNGLEPRLVVERLLVQNFVSIPAPVFPRRLALELGGMDDGLWYTGDWDLWLKLASAGRTVYYPRPLSAFRLHPESQTMRRSGAADEFRNQLLTVLERHLEASERRFRLSCTVRRVAYFSLELNAALASWAHGRQPNLFQLAPEFARLGPAGWFRFLRDSRVLERIGARIRLIRRRLGIARRFT